MVVAVFLTPLLLTVDDTILGLPVCLSTGSSLNLCGTHSLMSNIFLDKKKKNLRSFCCENWLYNSYWPKKNSYKVRSQMVKIKEKKINGSI